MERVGAPRRRPSPSRPPGGARPLGDVRPPAGRLPHGALIALTGTALLALAGVAAAALAVPPPPTARVNDYAGALSAGERDRLERKLAAREKESANQVVVAVFRSLEGENLEDYSIRLAQAWRIGQKGLDNGVIVLVFLDDRKMRLEVGYGLEASLTDAIAASIIRDVVAPRFREGKLADGIGAGLDALGQAIAGTYARPQPAGRQRPGVLGVLTALGVIGLVLLVTVGSAVRALRRGRRGGWSGGRGGWAPVAGGREWSSSTGSSSSGSSSSGSFSGGGGSFGGGGASGKW
jgi:uncharacterized protein